VGGARLTMSKLRFRTRDQRIKKVMENWFGIMKMEFLYQEKFETIESFKVGLKEYIPYNNLVRIKQKLKGLSSVR
jgi:putative transposase